MGSSKVPKGLSSDIAPAIVSKTLPKKYLKNLSEESFGGSRDEFNKRLKDSVAV